MIIVRVTHSWLIQALLGGGGGDAAAAEGPRVIIKKIELHSPDLKNGPLIMDLTQTADKLKVSHNLWVISYDS